MILASGWKQAYKILHRHTKSSPAELSAKSSSAFVWTKRADLLPFDENIRKVSKPSLKRNEERFRVVCPSEPSEFEKGLLKSVVGEVFCWRCTPSTYHVT
jgi:hypothetical protein